MSDATHQRGDATQLPDCVIEGLRQLQDDGERYQLAVGDFIVSVVDEFSHVVPRSQIIRQLAYRTGRDTSTYRDRETVCRYFPPEIRARYDGFTYSHWRALKSAGDEWPRYADLLAGDISLPVSKLRALIEHNGHLPPAWINRLERVKLLAEWLADDPLVDPQVRALCRVLSIW